MITRFLCNKLLGEVSLSLDLDLGLVLDLDVNLGQWLYRQV